MKITNCPVHAVFCHTYSHPIIWTICTIIHIHRCEALIFQITYCSSQIWQHCVDYCCCLNLLMLWCEQVCIWSCVENKSCHKENFSFWASNILSKNSSWDKNLDSIQAWKCMYVCCSMMFPAVKNDVVYKIRNVSHV